MKIKVEDDGLKIWAKSVREEQNTYMSVSHLILTVLIHNTLGLLCEPLCRFLRPPVGHVTMLIKITTCKSQVYDTVFTYHGEHMSHYKYEASII